MSGYVDLGSKESNMYGCLPCPSCKSVYRFCARRSYKNGKAIDHDKIKVVCDDCGLVEDASGPDGADDKWSR